MAPSSHHEDWGGPSVEVGGISLDSPLQIFASIEVSLCTSFDLLGYRKLTGVYLGTCFS